MRNLEDIAVVAVIAVTALFTTNLAIGFASGIALHLVFKTLRRYHTHPLPAQP